ncbi:type 2 isopentenyl-diphosphate Delta-isomerase [Lactobacillus acidophilus]|uniref:type 2 isopentenyl-diphosphate Delta-isomerase n=1 Tax=Lactobacillus acidophilus TaxID=1579 RepID=UPI00293F1D83|nr:type 2 isopentenyl-diphosphate Delta-isomerase [Lactobacillus acidophilus]WOH41307.1 type 2 isopentenyl-diphosphate Delta-isomerase [Lactobacillus acidophilus]
MSIRSQRKEEHLKLAQMFFNKEKYNSFDQLHLLRPALPETKVDINVLATKMFNKNVSAPFFINAMTGGSDKSKIINQALGRIANEENIALALGSTSILAKEKEQLDSFYIARIEDPNGILIANVNPETPVQTVKDIVHELHADALQIHINTIQEIAMPEGDRNFFWLNNIKEIRAEIDIPIIIKEVGFGLDQNTIHILKNEGISYFDIAGSGGTNFAQIENARNKYDVSYLEDIGLPTVISALMAQKEQVDFIVSGGVRNPLDVLKGLTLGGQYVGISNVFLQKFNDQGYDGLQQLIAEWKEQLAALIAVHGKNDLVSLTEIIKYYDLPLKNQIDQLIK